MQIKEIHNNLFRISEDYNPFILHQRDFRMLLLILTRDLYKALPEDIKNHPHVLFFPVDLVLKRAKTIISYVLDTYRKV